MLKYLEPYSPKTPCRFYLSGAGLNEPMYTEMVNRPSGTWDWFLIYSTTPIQIRIDHKLRKCPANTFMIWPDTKGHYYGNIEQQWNHSWLHCHGALIESILQQNSIPIYEPFQFNKPKIVEKYIRDFYVEKTSFVNPDAAILENIFINFIREISRVYNENSCDTEIPEPFLRVRTYIESKFYEKITLPKLAEIACYSPPHLISEFKKYFGCTPIDYLKRIRMSIARTLLLDQNLRVGQIATQVGYSDIFQFSKQFKSHFKCSPSELKRSLKKQKEKSNSNKKRSIELPESITQAD